MSWEERPYADPNFGRGGSGFSDNPLNWAPRIFTFDGIRVRVHILLILYIGYQLLKYGVNDAGLYIAGTAHGLFILFLSVFLHELGHCYAARAVGGKAEEVLLWPLGGLAFTDPPFNARARFITVLCGPLVNLALMVLAIAAMGFHLPRWEFAYWSPRLATWGSLNGWMVLIYQINRCLFFFNILTPMYPMDAGQLLQCTLWKFLGYRRATLITCTVGMVTAVVLGLYCVISQSWILLTIAFMGYMECYRTRMVTRFSESDGDDLYGRELVGGHAAFDRAERRREGFLARWRRKRAESRKAEEAVRQANVELEVDRILDKVHREGMHSLTKSEKRTLELATKLQRESRGPRV